MRLARLVFRAHHPRWVFQPASGKGAALHGGRFNPRGMEALYTSLRLETAWLEAQQAFPFKAQPMTIVACLADCEDIVDLTDAETRLQLGIGPADLSCAWEDLTDQGMEPPSWALARRLHAGGHAGILVPSFAPGAGTDDVNAVFWRWSDMPPHRLRVVDDAGRLPGSDRSWH